jgi:hypothetical protein
MPQPMADSVGQIVTTLGWQNATTLGLQPTFLVGQMVTTEGRQRTGRVGHRSGITVGGQAIGLVGHRTGITVGRQVIAVVGQMVMTEGPQVTVRVGHLMATVGQIVITDGQTATEGNGPVPGTQLTAALASSLPAPHPVLGTGPVEASPRAVLSRQALIWLCVRVPFFWNISAMVPVTCGAAIEVPPRP